MRRILLSTLLLSAFFGFTFFSCEQSSGAGNPGSDKIPAGEADTVAYNPTEAWKDYWFSGKGELTSYSLEQSRYGEIHEGTVVLVFVTEDFSRSEEVKLDFPQKTPEDEKVSVLKMNASVKFVTGIYPYSLLLSSFMPVDINNYRHALKVTATSQEWCGNAFFQLNNRDDHFDIEQRSYFEQEGDKDLKIDPVILEDELWNKIRIDPEKLPRGNYLVFPGALYLRLSHAALAPVQASLSLSEDKGMEVYSIAFPSLHRVLNIRFEKAFPYTIEGWDDTFPGLDGKPLTTTAKRMREVRTDYWTKHKNADVDYRDSLNLPEKWQ